MTLTMNNLVAMAWRSVKNPREGAAEILALGVPREALWPALALVVVLSILLANVTALLLAGDAAAAMPVGPAATGFIQLALLVVMVFAVFWIGRAMGGTGSFEESVLIVAWLQFIMVCLQVVQAGILVISTPVAEIFGLLGVLVFLWLLTNFVAVLHG
ncbi:MAG: YIP1 family protein, partial [Rhodobacteraceae bacterium]|nr:YIP1 family protein [Paracoccaceae bacterium]